MSYMSSGWVVTTSKAASPGLYVSTERAIEGNKLSIIRKFFFPLMLTLSQVSVNYLLWTAADLA